MLDLLLRLLWSHAVQKQVHIPPFPVIGVPLALPVPLRLDHTVKDTPTSRKNPIPVQPLQHVVAVLVEVGLKLGQVLDYHPSLGGVIGHGLSAPCGAHGIETKLRQGLAWHGNNEERNKERESQTRPTRTSEIWRGFVPKLHDIYDVLRSLPPKALFNQLANLNGHGVAIL